MLLEIFYLIFVLILYFIFKYCILTYIKCLRFKKYGEIKFYPILGRFYFNNLNFQKNKHALHDLNHIFDNNQNPKLIVTNFADRPLLVLFDIELIQEFYQLGQKYFGIFRLSIQNFERLDGNNFIIQKYDKWKQQRNIFSGFFHFSYLQKKVSSIETICQNEFKHLIQEKKLKNQDTIQIFQKIAAEVVFSTFIGIKTDNILIKNKTLQKCIGDIVIKLAMQMENFIYLIYPKYFELGLTQEHRQLNQEIKEFKDLLRKLIEQKIQEHKNNMEEEKDDLIYYLIKNNLLDNLGIDSLLENFIAFYFAGMDTTGHLCGMIIYYLTQHKGYKEKFVQEILNNKDCTQQGLQNLPYLNAVIKETQRFYGPTNGLFWRETQQDIIMKGIQIPKGTLIDLGINSVHRNPKFYENPHVFNPDRWLNKEASPHPYAFLSFSQGAKNCIGQHLAMAEARILMNYFVKYFDFDCDPNYQLSLNYEFLLTPNEKLRINLYPKKHQND